MAARKFEKTSTTYAIELGDDEFTNLLDSESYKTDHAALEPGASTLAEKLEKLSGVTKVDYNGHFGQFVYFTINAEDDNDDTRKAILETIDEHLEWCASLKAPETGLPGPS